MRKFQPGVLATTGSAFFPQIGEDEKSTPSGRIYKIHFDGPHLFKKVFVDNIGDTFLGKNLILFAWFVLNHILAGPRSASLVEHDTDGWDFLLIFHGFLDHLRGLFRNFKHGFLLQKFGAIELNQYNILNALSLNFRCYRRRQSPQKSLLPSL